ncbi:response regulator receiver protein [Desulfofarcimen acetoxidans DSM 771]|jgi:two-component system chemotaxis response regulator CheY|uniref:Stage 0 sporulation protein A homolog n=1 Tax=Desulfofarcimen acetoxidans (strain ATCC 49208 / DSM 771 / KCTC 5769 / VKM B-1644 / 5575) TaxID=485916 RepID=C8W0W8_DESAS|nr:response regulator [Desulfofarcimen acetoxidans]ACV61537.1 response regulator receiver protein [Desulfofarcimen acetoxidans DSM 771]
MKILIAEDDMASRKYLFKLLSKYGDCDITVDGFEALDAFMLALNDGEPYNLICLDIMMPRLDGVKTLKAIRHLEKEKGINDSQRVKIIMTTALNETSTVFGAFDNGCDAYAAKPIDSVKMVEVMQRLGLIT